MVVAMGDEERRVMGRFFLEDELQLEGRTLSHTRKLRTIPTIITVEGKIEAFQDRPYSGFETDGFDFF